LILETQDPWQVITLVHHVFPKPLPKILELESYVTYQLIHINIFGGCNGDRINKKSIFLYIFSFHVQIQNIRPVLEQQIKYLLSKSRTTSLLPCNDLSTSIGYKERMTPIQQLLKLIEKFSVYSFSGRIFSQFRYAFSYNLSASRHHFVNYMGCINIFGDNCDLCQKDKKTTFFSFSNLRLRGRQTMFLKKIHLPFVLIAHPGKYQKNLYYLLMIYHLHHQIRRISKMRGLFQLYKLQLMKPPLPTRDLSMFLSFRHHHKKQQVCFNIFGGFKDVLVSKAHRCLFIL